MKKILKYLVAIIPLIIGSHGAAYALPGYLATFNTTYGTSGTAMDSCLLCHTEYPTIKTNLNSYAISYRDNGHNFKTIELFDSDGDGGTNISEVNARTFPGDPASKIAAVTTPTAPVPQALMQLPIGQQVIPMMPVIYQSPIVSANPLEAMPFGFGPIAQGGIAADLHVTLGNLAAPADVYFALIMPEDPNTLYMVNQTNTLQPLANGLVPWVSNTSGGIDVPVFSNVSLAGMQPGSYAFALLLTPPGTTTFSDFYLWISGFTVAPPATPAPAPAVTDGATLYLNNCAACHGSLAASQKTGRTAAQTQWAIYTGIGGMGSLSSLTPAQVQAIADVLVPQAVAPTPVTPPTTTTTTTTTDGATLYSQNCASCHSTLASSAKKGTTASKIQNAINSGAGGMGGLKNLTAVQIQAIAKVLVQATPAPAPTPTPTTTTANGATLYSQNCASCHGVLAKSAKANRSAAQIQGAINANAGNMGGLKNLTAVQIQAIAKVLVQATPAPAPTPAPTTTTNGATLYSQNCASCHGSLANSAKANRSAAQIQGAINANAGNMGGLKNLTAVQIQAIAKVLVQATPTPAPTPAPTTTTNGATLYSQNCASCHGILANSAKANRSAAQIQGAINTNVGNMGGLKSLTAAQIQAIVAVLVQQTPAPMPTDGPSLYSQTCAGCHGPLTTSSVRGSSAAEIQKAITKNKGGMASLSTLTPAQIQAISALWPAGGND